MVQEFGYKANLEAASNMFGSAFSAASTSAANQTTEPSNSGTLLQRCGIKVTPPPSVDKGALMRDSSNPHTVSDLSEVKQAVASTKQDYKEARGATQAAHENAIGFAVELAKEAAPSVGLDRGAVDATYGKTCSTSEVASVAVDQGLGSMVTIHMSATADLVGAVNDEKNKMTQDQQDALCGEVAARINGQASVHQSQNIMDAFVEPTPADFSNADFNLSGCSGDDIKELLNSDFDRLDEVMNIDANLAELENVEANHGEVEAALEKDPVDPVYAAECSHESLLALSGQAGMIVAVGYEADAPEGLVDSMLDREAELRRAAELASNMTVQPSTMMSA